MVRQEITLCADERGNLLRRQDGMAVDEREVDAEPELLVAARDVDGPRKGSAARHDRRRAQAAVHEPLLHRPIDFRMTAEVVGIDDDVAQDRYLFFLDA